MSTTCPALYRTMNLLNVSMYIHVDLALIPMALYWNEKGNQAKVLAPFVQIQTKKKLKKTQNWMALQHWQPAKDNSSGMWAILLTASQSRANASNSAWTWQSALQTDGPTRVISNQEGASFQSQLLVKNVLQPVPFILNWKDVAYEWFQSEETKSACFWQQGIERDYCSLYSCRVNKHLIWRFKPIWMERFMVRKIY